jgi:predicted site-specific integrase-resolvase
VSFREVDVVEVREVLRGWLSGSGLRTVAERAGVDRKTARRYVQAAQTVGLDRDDVLQRIKTGQLHAVHIRSGRRRGLRIEISAQQPNLF